MTRYLFHFSYLVTIIVNNDAPMREDPVLFRKALLITRIFKQHARLLEQKFA